MHKVIDTFYSLEGEIVFEGTLEECEEYREQKAKDSFIDSIHLKVI